MNNASFESITTLTEYFSTIGTIIGILVNLSPGILYIEIVQKRRQYNEIPQTMLLSNLLCNCVNLSLGFVRNDSIIIISSSVGTALAVIWGIWYLYYSQEMLKQFLIFTFMILNLTIEFVWVFGFILKKFDYVTGIMAIVITIVNFATPGQNILKVIKTGKYRLIPIITTMSCVLCSGCWLIYGLIEFDYKLFIPNGLGILFATMQVIIWGIYYCKSNDRYKIAYADDIPSDTETLNEQNSSENDDNGSFK